MSASLNGARLLSLMDGTRLALYAADSDAQQVVQFLAQAAQLAVVPHPLPQDVRRVRVVVGDDSSDESATPAEPVPVWLEPTDTQRLAGRMMDEQGNPVTFYQALSPNQWLWAQLARLTAAIGLETAPRGGVLLHGALAEWNAGDGRAATGVLLGGRSGIGKTTASQALRPPWRSPADDMALVVRDSAGTYWAHPWPTWSRLLGGDVRHPNGRWDVQRAVPLRGLFFLEQAPIDGVEPIGPAQAVTRLSMLADQASRQQMLRRPLDEKVALNLQRFDNLCGLAKALPAFVLHVSLGGAFWREMERALHLGAGE